MEIDTKNPTSCLVCGGNAMHYNYGIPSCNSCKIFFRRCVLRNRIYKCKFNGSCNIDNKHYCKSCRLKLCIDLGMDAKKIDPNGRTGKTTLIKAVPKNQASRRTNIFETSATNLSSGASLNKGNYMLYYEVDNLLYMEDKLQQLRESTFNPEKLIFGTIQDILSRPSELGNANKYPKLNCWPLTNKDVIGSISEKLKMAAKTGQPLHTLRRFSLAIDNLIMIEAAKTLPCFIKLSFDDQIKLLKHIAVVNATLTECYYSIQNRHTTLVMPDGSVLIKYRLQQNKLSRNPIPINLLEEVFCQVIEPLSRVNITKTEYVLLKMLIYCYTGVNDISGYAHLILNEEAFKYSNILLRHLQIKHGETRGAQRYAEIISLIGTYFRFAEKHRQLYLLRKIQRNDTRSYLRLPQSPPLLDEVML